jgi:hypothetical protein
MHACTLSKLRLSLGLKPLNNTTQEEGPSNHRVLIYSNNEFEFSWTDSSAVLQKDVYVEPVVPFMAQKIEEVRPDSFVLFGFI